MRKWSRCGTLPIVLRTSVGRQWDTTCLSQSNRWKIWISLKITKIMVGCIHSLFYASWCEVGVYNTMWLVHNRLRNNKNLYTLEPILTNKRCLVALNETSNEIYQLQPACHDLYHSYRLNLFPGERSFLRWRSAGLHGLRSHWLETQHQDYQSKRTA